MFRFIKHCGRRPFRAGPKSKSAPRRCLFEGLEQRQLLAADAFVANGVLNVIGDNTHDVITVNSYDPYVNAVVSVTDKTTGNLLFSGSFAQSTFNSVNIQGLGGYDEIYYSLLQLSTIHGGTGNDVIYGNEGVDFIYGEDGDDTLLGFGGGDYLHGDFFDAALGNGKDVLEGGSGFDTLVGGGGDDTLRGGSGNDNLVGNAGNDTYSFSGHNVESDRVYEYAGSGTDTLDFADMDSGLDGLGSGLSLGSTAIQTVAMWNGNPSLKLTLSDAAGIENVVGSDYHDVIFGNDLANDLQGGAGDDEISGYGGNDTLEGGSGSFDWLSGSSGHDTYVFRGYAFALGYDIIFDSLDEYAGSGSDTLDFSGLREAATVDLSNTSTTQVVAGGPLTYLTLRLAPDSPIENVIGSAFRDTITGNASVNTLQGLGDVDHLYGGDNTDYLHGGDGGDHVYGGEGVDFLYGGNGVDWLLGQENADHLYGGEDGDWLAGGDGVNHLHGGAGDDVLNGGADFDWYYFGSETFLGHDKIHDSSSVNGLYFGQFNRGISLDLATSAKQYVQRPASPANGLGAANLELTLNNPGAITNVIGSRYADIIFGNSKANYLEGQGGNDVIWGRGGDDHLWGDAGLVPLIGTAGVDELYGESGDDELNGGIDNFADKLVGGAGRDKFFAEWYWIMKTLKNRDNPSDFNSSEGDTYQ